MILEILSTTIVGIIGLVTLFVFAVAFISAVNNKNVLRVFLLAVALIIAYALGMFIKTF